MTLLVIGCYSRGTPYEQEAALLRRSLDAVGMEHCIVGFHDRGDWFGNTAAKAEMIRTARYNCAGPLLYADVDAFFHSNCASYFEQLAAEDYDFGAHWFAGPAGGHNKAAVCPCVHGGECDRDHRLLSGTLFLGDTEDARRLCDAWVAKNEKLRAKGIREGGGQKNLWSTVEEIGHQLRIERIPGRYCYVFDKKWAYPPDEPCIIEHTIASRDHRPHDNGRPKTTTNDARAERKSQLHRLVDKT